LVVGEDDLESNLGIGSAGAIVDSVSAGGA
jgi:hypothetical protein